jgi:hypothetical protein
MCLIERIERSEDYLVRKIYLPSCGRETAEMNALM